MNNICGLFDGLWILLAVQVIVYLLFDSSRIQKMLWFDIVICISTSTSKLWTTEWLWTEYILPNFKQGHQLDETWTILSWLTVVKSSTYFRRWMPGCAAGQFPQQVLLPNTHTVLSCTQFSSPHHLCCPPPPPTPPNNMHTCQLKRLIALIYETGMHTLSTTEYI